MVFIWGENLAFVLEAVFLGVSLLKDKTRHRVAMVEEKMLKAHPEWLTKGIDKRNRQKESTKGIDRGKIYGIHKCFNAQLSQFIISAQMPEAESEWSELLQDPSKVVVYHFSAKPKPLDLMLGSCHYSFKNEHPWHETKAQHHFAEAWAWAWAWAWSWT